MSVGACEAPTPVMEPDIVYPPPMLVPETVLLYDQLLAGAEALGNEAGDNFGWAVVAGDFNCDGVQDMAVGIPYQWGLAGQPYAGAVAIFFGDDVSPPFREGPVLRASPFGPVQPNALFGYTLASGDFDGDACDDLAVGAPSEDVQPSYADAGRVYVRFGDPEPNAFSRGQRLGPEGSGYDHKGDNFAFALAAGDFNGDAYDDLAIGAPYTDYGLRDSGYVHVRHGSATGLGVGPGSRYGFSPSPAGTYCLGMGFGISLAAGNFDGSSYDDLAIGAWGCHDGRANEVYLRKGLSSGLACAAPGCYETVSSGTPHPNDWFGFSLAAGDLQGDGADDLIVGNLYVAPSYVGQVEVFRGFPGIFPPEPSPSDIIQQPVHDSCPTETNALFGYTLATGDFDDDGVEDIAIGVPLDQYEVPHDGGAVAIRSGAPVPSSSATREAGYACVTQEETDETLADEHYGFAIAAVDLAGGIWDAGPVDLLIGAPRQDKGAWNSGALFITNTAPVNELPFTGRYTSAGPNGTLGAILVEFFDSATNQYVVAPFVYVESGVFTLSYWNCHFLHPDQHSTYYYAGDTVISGGRWQLDDFDDQTFSGSAQSAVNQPNAIGMGTTNYNVLGQGMVFGQWTVVTVQIAEVRFAGSVFGWGSWWDNVDVSCPDFQPTSLVFLRD